MDIAAKQVNRSFDYLIPAHLEKVIKVGCRVKVYFGKRVLLGFVVKIKEHSSYHKNLKEILDLVDVEPVLNLEFIELAQWIAEKYFSYYAVALQTMIPTAMKIKYQKVAKLIQPTDELKEIFKNRNELIIDHRTKEELEVLYQAYEQGFVKLDTKFKRVRNEKLATYIYVLNQTIRPKSKQGCELLDYLVELGEPILKTILIEDSGFSKSVLDTLLKNQILGSYQKELKKQEEIIVQNQQYPMTPEQTKVFNNLELGKYQTYLLHGVTGSGKTLLYMNWIEAVLKLNKQAIMLVPEISLTPQITSIFINRFGNDVAILHSRLTIYEKYEAWKKILNHEVHIVIGARSAIFAPLDQLGIIIIDEEHESSYIQDNNPRYSAIEVAQKRGQTHHCPVVLGSATPQVNDYYFALNKEYQLLTLPHRVENRPLPTKKVVDMTLELKSGNKSVFSKALQNQLIDVFHRHEQSILFLNRRGFSSFVMCRSCGEVIKCPHCDVSLTYHASTNLLKCHHCGYSKMNVEACPSCGSSKIRFVGSGTEKVMKEIESLLPEARIIRLDMDTAHHIRDYEDAFTKFKNHEADILIGTQMIAKGLDFENVTLVGIINADLALYYPSYDANSTAYNLIEQVAGRAGRGQKPGDVIIQTYQPKHFVIESVLKNSYDAFFNQEIQNRRLTKMPPFSTCIEIMILSKDANLAYQEAKNVLLSLKKVAVESEVLGPAEAFPFKLNDVFRFTIQLKIVEDAVLNQIDEIYPLYQTNKAVDLKIRRM